MVGLIRAELLKIRRRQATYVVLAVALFLMVAIFFVAGAAGAFAINGLIEFPGSYSFINQFCFGLGGLLAIVYAAAYVGADWNWGVVRNVVARGEGRERYLLAKFVSVAIVLALATVLRVAVCFVLLYLQALIYNVPVANPFRANG